MRACVHNRAKSERAFDVRDAAAAVVVALLCRGIFFILCYLFIYLFRGMPTQAFAARRKFIWYHSVEIIAAVVISDGKKLPIPKL